MGDKSPSRLKGLGKTLEPSIFCTAHVVSLRPNLPALKAWRNWLTLFAWHQIVSTTCPCLLVSPPPNFSNILCSSSTFYMSASKCFWFRSKTFLLVGKQMLVLLWKLASFAMQIWLLAKLANKVTKLRIVILDKQCWPVLSGLKHQSWQCFPQA